MILKELTDLEDSIFKCDKCLELSESRLYPMPGFSGSNVKLMIIGINPGPPQNGEAKFLESLFNDYRKHYEIGIRNCFVGKFLTKALESMNITWDNIYFTNIIKCATPNVRLPNENEVKNCQPYLLSQIKLLRPKNILLLGKFPIEAFQLNMKLMEHQIIGHTQIITIPHPTYIRRSGLEKSVLDFLTNIVLL